MFSIGVVALFFLMVLAPCFFALRARRDMAVPSDETLNATYAKEAPVDPRFEPSPIPVTAVEAAEDEVLLARHNFLVAESAVLAAEAKLAQVKAKIAADHAALASRAASQAALAADQASRAAGSQNSKVYRTAVAQDEQVVDGSDLPETHPSMDFPRSRIGRRAA